MKTLLVLRHGKSSWDDPALDDHDRPLKGRGKRDAATMGRLLAKRGLVPDRILSSTAKRARSTVRRAAEAAKLDLEIALDSRIYEAPPGRIVEALRALRGGARALLVGHNPGLEGLLEGLTGEHALMPTGALARLELDIAEWTELRLDGRARLVSVWRPRELD